MKRALIIILITLIVAPTAIFFYRYQLLQYSAENVIRSILPPYVKIDKIIFSAKDGKISLGGFKILNPPGFFGDYLFEIESISCRYRMKGKNILDGIELLEPSFKKLTLNIERLSDGKTNLGEMKNSLEKAGAGTESVTPAAGKESRQSHAISKIIGDRVLSDIIKIPGTFRVRDGKVIFIDRFVTRQPRLITFENINATLSIRLDDNYSKILDLNTTGEGNLSGNRSEAVKWVVHLNPMAPRLTMSNRFEVSNLDILAFEPYYDRYSPFVFKKGKFSGTLIFDFDNGNIGSTNEVRLSDFVFYIKRGYESAQFWETTVPDLARYLTTSFGEIVFDFKIKGDMSDPKFYLGPISKQAIASMAIGKISSAIQQIGGQPSGGAKSDIEKAKEYIDLFRGLLKKN